MATVPHGVSQGLARVAALAALIAVMVYPVSGMWGLAQLPLAVKVSWLVAAVGAAVAPRASLLVFIAGAPLLLTAPSLLRWPSVSVPELWLSALLVPAFLRRLVQPRSSRMPSAGILLGVLATASLLATLYPLQYGQGGVDALLLALGDFVRSELPTLSSQRHLFSSVLAWVVFCEGLALLWLTLDTFEGATHEAAPRLALALSASCTVVALVGIYQRYTGQHLLDFWRVADPYVVRINATFTDVNVLGSYLASILPVLVTMAVVESDRGRRLTWWGGVVAVILATIFTGSRAAWLAALVGVGIWMMSRGLLSRRRVVNLSGAVAAVLIVLAMVGTVRDVRATGARSYIDVALYTVNLRAPLDERLKGRPELWKAAAGMVIEHPLTGVGIGRYYKEVAGYATDPDALIRPQENAHNYFLQVAAELGLPALMVLGLLLLPLYWGSVADQEASAHPSRPWVVAAVAGMSAHLLTWLTGHPLLIRDGQITFWPLVGLGLLAMPRTLARSWPCVWPQPLLLCATAAALLVGGLAADANARRVDLSRAPLGVYETEEGPLGQTFRWTKERASLYVPSSSRAFTLTMRSLAPFPQTVTVMLDGKPVDELAFADHEWRTSRYQLSPGESADRFHRFDLIVSPTWVPPDDGRTLGILLGDVSWTP